MRNAERERGTERCRQVVTCGTMTGPELGHGCGIGTAECLTISRPARLVNLKGTLRVVSAHSNAKRASVPSDTSVTRCGLPSHSGEDCGPYTSMQCRYGSESKVDAEAEEEGLVMDTKRSRQASSSSFIRCQAASSSDKAGAALALVDTDEDDAEVAAAVALTLCRAGAVSVPMEAIGSVRAAGDERSRRCRLSHWRQCSSCAIILCL
jgi:hypothetical protein